MNIFIALRNHTPYSLLEGAVTIERLIQIARSCDMPALGMADSGHLFGAMEFSLTCQKHKIHPILGCRLMVWGPSETCFPLVFYAQSAQGYQNLCRLVSDSTVGQEVRWRNSITWSQLDRAHEGLLALTGGPEGPLDALLDQGQQDKALAWLRALQGLFPDRLYLELSRYEALKEDGSISENVSERRLNTETQIIDWALHEGLPLIATNCTLFAQPEDHEAHDVLRCIALGRYVQEEDRPRSNLFMYFRKPEEMQKLFEDIPEAIDNTRHLMQRCHFILKNQSPMLPAFPCARSEETELWDRAQEGLHRRLQQSVLPLLEGHQHAETIQTYQQRLQYEYEVITQMGFSGYFLIVSDFIQWAKSHGIPVGPGRGSGASSLIAWALQITDIDPIRFNLFFERFMNPERVSMPDFDIDFCQSRRDEVIQYVQEKYGHDRVAQIVTFGTLQARAVLRDVGRTLQMPYTYVDKICKLIPHNPTHPVSLSEALKIEPQLNNMAQSDDQVETLLDIGLKLEGLYRHVSTHAAGIIIAPQPLRDMVPLYQDENASLAATEYSLKYIEGTGLIKFDFLGLKTLTIIQSALDMLVAQRKIHIDMNLLPLDDARTFELLRRVETVGIFQLESSGMCDVLQQLQPHHFEEIVALVALYRPGPMDEIPRYLACRHGRDAINQPYAAMESLLKETFGVLVYQEQVLQVARVVAGYSLGEADLLRRAIGKKVKSEMDAQCKIFVEGTLKTTGGSEATARELFEQIKKFASYAFPKAHAVPYGLLAYQTAYLKANYPVEFLTALMMHDAQNTDKLLSFVKEAKRMEIPILLPDINHSQENFSVENGNNIRYGLCALKGVGENLMTKVIQERQKHGHFSSIFDFAQRTLALGVNKKSLESLIMSGAFDLLHAQRSALMASVPRLLRIQKPESEEGLLFCLPTEEFALEEAPDWNMYETLSYERQALGFYLSAHPLDSYQSTHFVLAKDIAHQSEESTFPTMGIVMDISEKISKSGQKYGFLHLSDPSGYYEVTLFADVLAQSRPLLIEGKALALKISVRGSKESRRLSASFIMPLEHYPLEENLHLKISSIENLLRLHSLLAQATEGSVTICGELCADKVKVRFRMSQGYCLTPMMRSEIRLLDLESKTPYTKEK